MVAMRNSGTIARFAGVLNFAGTLSKQPKHLVSIVPSSGNYSNQMDSDSSRSSCNPTKKPCALPPSREQDLQ